MEARSLRERFQFEVERIREAAHRLELIDEQLRVARARLEDRARVLSIRAVSLDGAERAQVTVLSAKAQALGALARKAALRVLLSTAGSGLALVAAMATSRWIWELQGLRTGPKGAAVKSHVETGRIAYRILRSLRRRAGLVGGIGQLTSAVVVAEFVHADDLAAIEAQIEEGFARGRQARGLHTGLDVIAATSRALREAALVLERVAGRAEPLVVGLSEEERGLEAAVERRLSGA